MTPKHGKCFFLALVFFVGIKLYFFNLDNFLPSDQDGEASTLSYELPSEQEKFIARMIKNELPEWLQTYLSWHASKRAELAHMNSESTHRNTTEVSSLTKNFRFLAVLCVEGLGCGGTSDRLKQLPYWILQANLTNRILLIYWDRNDVFLSDYLIPPPGGMDWAVPSNKSTVLNTLFHGKASCVKNPDQIIRGTRPISEFVFQDEQQIICVDDQLYNFPQEDKEYYRHGNQRSCSYPYVFRTMFQPSNGLVNYIEAQLNHMSSSIGFEAITFSPTKPYLSVHIRANYPMNGPEGRMRLSIKEDYAIMAYIADHAVETVIEKYMNETGVRDLIPPIYVASDSVDIIHYLKFDSVQFGSVKDRTANSRQVKAPKTQIISLNEHENRTHINFMNNFSGPSDLYNVFFDIWMLSNGVCIATGAGGYGQLAFTISMLSQDCQINHRVWGNWVKIYTDATHYWHQKNLSSYFYKPIMQTAIEK